MKITNSNKDNNIVFMADFRCDTVDIQSQI